MAFIEAFFVYIIGLIVGVIFGLLVGKIISDNNWKRNAHNPQRILRDECFYKVILVDYKKSWDLAHIHFKFSGVGCEEEKDD